MANNIAIGIQDFEKIRTKHCFYIDKTSFIKEWWENNDDVTLITRPRRFGKTLNMSMVEQFFSMKYADRGDLFEGLSIWTEEKYRNIQGTYPVISLSFAGVKGNDYTTLKEKICQMLTNLYSKFFYLRDSEVLNVADRAFFDRMLVADLRTSDATSSLYQLSEYLYRYYGKKVIILLDEYDTPMQEAYVHGFWDELISFIGELFNYTFKTNPCMERAIMTGITRISKESIFSDLNNLEVVTTTSDKYATSFGFMEEEVFTSLEANGLGTEKDKVKVWYNGFVFGEHRDIYNPWSILNFLDKGKYVTYWSNTSSNSLVNKLIREGNCGIKQSMEKLLKGENIICPINEQIVYNQLDNNEEAIWSLLVASGYLKILSYEQIEIVQRRPNYKLALTNGEVRLMFEEMISDWFAKEKVSYNGFINAMMKDDLEGMNEYMNQISCEIFSYFDTGKRTSKKAQPERFYHGFILGLVVELKERYCITSNRESGYGRYDIMLEPVNAERGDAIIIEFKVFNPQKEKTIEDTVQSALQQIDEKKYEGSLVAKGIPKEKIRKYGFAFEGKSVLIGAGD